ncbi:MAG: hypothetical protein OXU20_34445, partial [Myxococcales bacterium]|nr:hypothetical protein [Myxococcales bacterium]MDD9970135.1 hypothetical protein [Myxococcales bacterium]
MSVTSLGCRVVVVGLVAWGLGCADKESQDMATLPTEAGGAGMAGGPAQVPPTSGSAENSSTTTGGQMAGPVLGPVSTPMDDGMAAPMDDGMAAP